MTLTNYFSGLRQVHDLLAEYDKNGDISKLMDDRNVVARYSEMFKLNILAKKKADAKTVLSNEIDRLCKEVYAILHGYSGDPELVGLNTHAPRHGPKEFPLYPDSWIHESFIPWYNQPWWERQCRRTWRDDVGYSGYEDEKISEVYLQPLSEEYARRLGMARNDCDKCKEFAADAEQERRQFAERQRNSSRLDNAKSRRRCPGRSRGCR